MERTRGMTALIIAAIGLASLAVMSKQLVGAAVYSCYVEDTAYYLNWTRQFAASLAEGNLYPRWMPESHAGFGNPTFIFYPPLVSYITALIFRAGGDVVLAVNIVKLAGLFLSGLTMYVFVKDIYGEKAGLVSAVVYMVLPLRVFDLYVSGLHSIRVAFVLFPLVLHLARKSAGESGTWRYTAWLAVSFAVLCLVHPLAAYMIMPALVAFGLLSAAPGERLKGLFRVALASVLGVSMSAFYILPALKESGLVHFEELQKYFWGQYWQNYVFNPPGEFRFLLYPLVYAGSLLTFLVGFGIYMYSGPFKARPGRRESVFFLALCLAVMFMMSSYSGFLWAGVPGMRMMQFPKRWLYLLVMGSACLAGAGVGLSGSGHDNRPRRARAAWVIIILIFLAGVAYFDARIVGSVYSLSSQDVKDIPKDTDVFEYVPSGVSLDWLKCEETWRISRGGTCMDEVSRVEDGKPGRLDFRVGRWGSEARSVTVETDADAALRVRTFNYPGWHAYIDGREAPISTEGISGAMLIDMPGGTHELSLKFTDTPYRKAAKLISAVSALGVAYLFTRRKGLTA